MTVTKRGGRKVILAPDNAVTPRRPGKVDNTLVRALARAFRWRKLIETGVYGTIAELAAAEKVNPSYISRLLRLTLLAPELVDSVLDHQVRPRLTVASVTRLIPVGWRRQRTLFLE